MIHEKSFQLSISMLLLMILSCAFGQTNVDLKDGIPVDTVRTGPHSYHSVRGEVYNYRDKKTQEVIGEEHIRNGNRIKLLKYKNGKQHGIQKEWYENGKLKAEETYFEGKMHGAFRYWSEDGDLVGNSLMDKGNGTIIKYFKNGRIREEVQFKDNSYHGNRFRFYDNGQARSLNRISDFRYQGLSISFHENGEVYCIGQYNANGKLQGAGEYFDEKGNPGDVFYYIDGEEVTRAEYDLQRKVRSDLPDVPLDPKKYRQTFINEFRPVVERYKAKKPVRIPLAEEATGGKAGTPMTE